MNVAHPDVAVYDTFPKLLAYNAENWPNEIDLREKTFGIWKALTWNGYQELVRNIALGLTALGIGRGAAVGLIGDNRPEWVAGEIGVHAVGGMIFGIYQDSLNEEVAYLINYAGARVILAEDEEQVDKVLEITELCPCVEHIIYSDPRGMRKYDDPRLMSLAELLDKGAACHQTDPDAYASMIAAGCGSDTAILCPTSGTTSKPKLAMLQAGPMLRHCTYYLQADPREPGDNYVSVLPLPWIMEQIYAVCQALMVRLVVNFVEEPETQMADLREIGPHFVLLAPRVWESLAADVQARMMDASPFKRWVYQYCIRRAIHSFKETGKPSKLAYWLIFKPLKDRLGFSRLRSAATGGAALGPDTFKFFLSMGVPLRQIYGQTELAGAYTIHAADDVDYDSVGVPFEGSDIRIDNPDENGVGEIIARNPGMFSGYYKNDEATRESVDAEGWMATGDAGYFKPENGHLVVIDRISDIAITACGARFSPQFIENKLKFSPFIAEVVVLGNERPFLTAMVCIRFDIVAKWAEKRGIAFTNYINLSAQDAVYERIQREVEAVNATLPEAHRIRKFLLLYKQLDADDGELTRTRKVRRGVIREVYSDIIAGLYSDSDSIPVDTTITFQDGTTSRVQTALRVVEMGL
ncbi:MAG: long-chain fatty acid--CoA ligase [Desulfuromonas sp.]|nr:MAG: long-chain fatty acid--CoA ligase [Desulfuromonas sp.]